jgi:hypothetical protein
MLQGLFIRVVLVGFGGVSTAVGRRVHERRTIKNLVSLQMFLVEAVIDMCCAVEGEPWECGSRSEMYIIYLKASHYDD